MQGGVWHSGLEKSKKKCPEGQHISSAKFQRERAETNKSKGCRVPGKRKGRVETAGIVQLCQHSAAWQID